ncbi:phage major capsid protein [Heyndrickxia acidicola]|uniref:Phage major capsid protein n=1 Tax=Heyndrickxia acidicola TaxID=209389 RepID=A0ABU6MMC6_9BACI|nr:phage major capsid protein [Heyndrickxia acidicola]MED1205842.1 phage major capsid protein [Heyndrickxia acidicola]
MNIETMKNAWISAGQKVSDVQNELSMAVMNDEVTAEEVKALQSKLESAKLKRDVAKEQMEEAQLNAQATLVMNTEVKPLTNKEQDQKAKFIADFKGLIKGDPAVKALVSSELDSNGNGIGLTIPQDIQTAIRNLKRQYDALEQYVRVEPVTTLSGSRVIEKWTDVTALQNLDNEDEVLGNNDDPQLTVIKYLISRYGGLSTITNSLLKDTAENIVAYITQWIAKKSTVTRNAKILSVINSLPAAQKKPITSVDDIKDIYNVQLDPAIQVSSIFITSQSGFNILDKVKDAYGRYLLQPDPSAPTQKLLFGKPVKVISDKWLAPAGTAQAPLYPLFIGDLNEAVTLFDREQMSLATTMEGAGAFEKDQTIVRVIDRFDVALADSEAVVFAQFGAIADEKPSA